jgi:hypothetical protein
LAVEAPEERKVQGISRKRKELGELRERTAVMRPFCLVAAVTLAVVSVEPHLSAQKQRQLFISVTAPDGKPVEGLRANEVGVTEDGVDCKVVNLEPIDWPMRLQVLVDNGRANTNPINSLRDGLKALVEQLPDGVELALYVTAGSVHPIVKPTADKQKFIDGINLIAPDSGAGMFFDALKEAADRIDKEKTPSFPVILMVGSDVGRIRVIDQEYQKLQETIINRGITTHIIVMAGVSDAGVNTAGAQTDIGLQLTKLSGGRYEGINATTRLTTLLPEFGKQIAKSQARQSHQYRVTYERPAKASLQPRIAAEVRRAGTVDLSLHGNFP